MNQYICIQNVRLIRHMYLRHFNARVHSGLRRSFRFSQKLRSAFFILIHFILITFLISSYQCGNERNSIYMSTKDSRIVKKHKEFTRKKRRYNTREKPPFGGSQNCVKYDQESVKLQSYPPAAQRNNSSRQRKKNR